MARPAAIAAQARSRCAWRARTPRRSTESSALGRRRRRCSVLPLASAMRGSTRHRDRRSVMPRFAALDLGSNALRLRIVEAHASASRPRAALAPARRRLVVARGRRASAPRYASAARSSSPASSPSASIGQACTALREFRQSMDDAKVDAYRATATSAVREASNGTTLVERARREAGIELEVIEGIEEARLIQLAVVRRLGARGQARAARRRRRRLDRAHLPRQGHERLGDLAPDRHGAPPRDVPPRREGRRSRTAEAALRRRRSRARRGRAAR